MEALNVPLRENKKAPSLLMKLKCEAVKFGYINSEKEAPETEKGLKSRKAMIEKKKKKKDSAGIDQEMCYTRLKKEEQNHFIEDSIASTGDVMIHKTFGPILADMQQS
ncbi:hypothetical protein V6N11_053219 [Hibiscus sabdariffa]|uniref:Uncharacterized protein n=1 Tax=Hibiscus sabdariffa TaxID=183260 RepID=A0ABR2UCE3_9ROSI